MQERKQEGEMKQYLIIKCGGSILDRLTPAFYQSIHLIQSAGRWAPIIVHGGGPAISKMLKRLAIPTSFHDGRRVTTKPVLEIAEMVLSGRINKQLVDRLYAAGVKAAGVSGVDGRLLTAQVAAQGELGLVGDIRAANPDLLIDLCDHGFVPVVSPVCADEDGQHLNVNADQAASAVASALNGCLCFIGDVPGVLVEQSGRMKCLKQITDRQIAELIRQKKIAGGMIPKVMAAVDGLKHHVAEAVIVDGLCPECLVDYSRGARVGTKIVLEEEILRASC
jgi:acetylglutamate kinase